MKNVPLEDVCYHGPEELKSLWLKFAQNYANDDSIKPAQFPSGNPRVELLPYRVQTLNALDDLAFGGGVEAYIERESKLTAQQAKEARQDLEHVALALSDMVKNEKKKPLQRAIATAIIKQWVELEKKYDLFKACEDKTLITAEEKGQLLEKENSLLQSAQGSLLANTLNLLEHYTLESHFKLLIKNYKRRNQNLNEQYVQDAIDKIFRACLFHYDPLNEKGAHFTTYLQRSLALCLKANVYKQQNSKEKYFSVTSHDPSESDAQSILDRIVDYRETNSAVAADLHEAIRDLTNNLSKLDEREANIIKKRFGFGEDAPHTLKEIGDELHISKERVRQIEATALAKLKESSQTAQPDDATFHSQSATPPAPHVLIREVAPQKKEQTQVVG